MKITTALIRKYNLKLQKSHFHFLSRHVLNFFPDFPVRAIMGYESCILLSSPAPSRAPTFRCPTYFTINCNGACGTLTFLHIASKTQTIIARSARSYVNTPYSGFIKMMSPSQIELATGNAREVPFPVI